MNHIWQCEASLGALLWSILSSKKVQVGKDQEKAQSERDSHPKNRFYRVVKFVMVHLTIPYPWYKKVQVGKDQEKAQSEKDSHSKNRGGKKPN